MKALSQRDSRWANEKLGTSNTTIGGFGCTITALTMLAGLDSVSDTNSRLKSVNGFSNGNLLIWSKIESAIPWLKFTWRGYDYDNDPVVKAISQAGGCLVEVNGAPIGGTKHWVLYIGGGKMIDPWDGKEKPTTSYSATGYATIEKLGNAPESDTMEIDKATFERLVGNSTKYDEFVNAGYNNAQQVIDQKADLDKKVSDYEEKVFKLREDIRTLEGELAECESQTGIEEILEEIDGYEINGIRKTYFQENKETEVNYKLKEI